MFEQKIKIQKRETAPASQKNKEFSKESLREELACSLRAHFKKAIALAVLPIALTAETVGFSKKDVEQKLNEQSAVSQYLKHADMLSKEGDAERGERAILLRAVERGDTLKRIFGESQMDDLVGITTPFKEPAEVQSYPNILGDVESVGVSTETVDEILGRLPHRWVEKIESILFKKETREASLRYRFKGRRTAADVEHDYNTNRSKVTFYQLPSGREEETAGRFLAHEVAHSNDWRDRRYPVIERIEMLYRVLSRLVSKNRFRSGHVEEIQNDDEEIELALKVKEYWAEIAAQYFADKDALPEQDRALVEWRLAPPKTRSDASKKEY